MAELGNQRFPAMQTDRGSLIWPWGRVQKRPTNGAEDNVWTYYQVISK
jgi:hypothetical protein